MPIAVVCPACTARLNAPDPRAGKTVKCPKCETQVPVPLEGPRPSRYEDEGPVRSRRPDSRYEDDRHDERHDFDDRPRGERKKSSALPLILILGLGGFVAVVGLGAVFYLFRGGAARVAPPPPVAFGPGGPGLVPMGPGGPMNGVPAAEPKWIDADDEAFDFLAAFPNRAPAEYNPIDEITDPADRARVAAAMKGAPGKHLQVSDAGRRYLLSVTPVPPKEKLARVSLRRAADDLVALHKGYGVRREPEHTTSVHPFQNFTFTRGATVKIVRIVASPKFTYTLTVEGGLGLSHDDPVVDGFFDEFECTGAAAVAPKTIRK